MAPERVLRVSYFSVACMPLKYSYSCGVSYVKVVQRVSSVLENFELVDISGVTEDEGQV